MATGFRSEVLRSSLSSNLVSIPESLVRTTNPTAFPALKAGNARDVNAAFLAGRVKRTIKFAVYHDMCVDVISRASCIRDELAVCSTAETVALKVSSLLVHVRQNMCRHYV